jgi:uncharacterized protein YbjT (DUF2867 family)
MRTEGQSMKVLVAGATGRLGGLVDVLQARGHFVRAITRTPESPAAQRMRSRGIEVVYGNHDDLASLTLAAAGVDALFATGTAHKAGPEGERRHGLNLAAAASAAGVPHLVYSSGDGASPDSSVPLLRVKHEVEEHIRSLPIAHTILAPVYFMENLFNPWNVGALRAGTFPAPIPVAQPLQQLAIADLLSLVAKVIEQPERFAGERIAIASEELTAVKAADVLSAILPRRFDAEQVSAEQLPPPLQALFSWLQVDGHHVDIAALHRLHPDVRWHSYGAWARRQRASFGELCRQARAVAGAP